MFYNLQIPYDWDDVRVTLERMKPIESNSTCAEYEANYNAGDIRSVLLTQGKNKCLKANIFCRYRKPISTY